MNRMEEYRALVQALDEVPARLDSAVSRAKAKAKRRRLRRAVGVPVTGLAAVCVCFVLLVNVSAPFAAACADIPLIRGLAEAVSFSPSLSAAVENDWVQPIGLTQSANGAEMTVESVIVDEKQLNIFYTTGGDAAPLYDVDIDVLGSDGAELQGYGILSYMALPNGELQRVSVDFTSAEYSMPDALRLVCRLIPLDGESAAGSQPSDGETERTPVAVFTFDLTFDPQFTQQGKTVQVGKWVELDGQRILFRDVEIYPTHIRVNLEDGPDNTAWLRGLDFYAEDENGVRYEAPGGITAVGSSDSPFFPSFRLESSFFSESERLTLYITQAKWLDKDRRWTWVDTATGETGFLPDEVSLSQVSRYEDGVSMSFRILAGPAGLYNPFTRWRDPGGQAEYFGSISGGVTYDPEGREDPAVLYSGVSFTLAGCSGDRVELELDYSRKTSFDAPVEISLP